MRKGLKMGFSASDFTGESHTAQRGATITGLFRDGRAARILHIAAHVSRQSFCRIGIGAAAELLPIQFLEWVYFRADGVFVLERRQDLLPPLIVSLAHRRNDLL